MNYDFVKNSVSNLESGSYLRLRLERDAKKEDFDLYKISRKGQAIGFLKEASTARSVDVELLSSVSAKEIGEILTEYFWANHPVVHEGETQVIFVDGLGEGGMQDLLSSLKQIGFKYSMSCRASYGQGGYYTDLGAAVFLKRELPKPKESVWKIIWDGIAIFLPKLPRTFSRD